MVTIDKLDISIYNDYARRTQMLESIKLEYHFEEAEKIPPQTHIIAIFPRLTEMDLLLGVISVNTPWALYLPPPQFPKQRRSPFTFSRVVPLLGSEEKQEADLTKLAMVECESPEEEEERSFVLACYDQLDKLNSMLNFIIGRIGQFLQG